MIRTPQTAIVKVQTVHGREQYVISKRIILRRVLFV